MYFLLEVTFFPKILFKDSTINFYSSFPLYLKPAENGLQSRSRCHGLSWTVMDDSWMTFMDDFHGWLSFMIFMDDFHWWLLWMTVMDDFHVLVMVDWTLLFISYFYILISYGLTDGQTDLHWYLLSRYRDWKFTDVQST